MQHTFPRRDVELGRRRAISFVSANASGRDRACTETLFPDGGNTSSTLPSDAGHASRTSVLVGRRSVDGAKHRRPMPDRDSTKSIAVPSWRAITIRPDMRLPSEGPHDSPAMGTKAALQRSARRRLDRRVVVGDGRIRMRSVGHEAERPEGNPCLDPLAHAAAYSTRSPRSRSPPSASARRPRPSTSTSTRPRTRRTRRPEMVSARPAEP